MPRSVARGSCLRSSTKVDERHVEALSEDPTFLDVIYNTHQNMQNIYGRKSSTRDLLFHKKSRVCMCKISILLSDDHLTNDVYRNSFRYNKIFNKLSLEYEAL